MARNESTNPAVNFGGGRTDNHGIIEKASDSKATLRKLLKFFVDFKGLFIGLVILVAIQSGALVAIPSLEGSAIDAIFGKDFSALVVILVWLLVMFALQSVGTLFQTRLSARLSLSITKKMRTKLFERIIYLPISYLDSHSSGDVVARMTVDVETISATLSQTLCSFVSAALSILGTLVVIFISSWQLALITLVTVFLTVFSTKKLSKIMAKQFRKKAAINGRLSALGAEMINNYSSVALYGRQDDIISEYGRLAGEYKAVGIKAESLSNGVGPVLDCISNIGFVIVAVFGGIFALNGIVSIGVVSAFIVYAKQFIRPVNEVAQIFGQIQTAIAGAERVFSVLEEPVEDLKAAPSGRAGSNNAAAETDAASESAAAFENAAASVGYGHITSGAVAFENVCFSYKEDVPVIKNFSLDIRPGQKIALVGSTGSGKTTLASLLLRLYECSSGRITIDGTDIADMSLEYLRSSIAIVLQDTELFTGSILDNIRYARPEASTDEVRSAAALGGCSSFIERLPEGYDTRLLRAGANLSAGQRQLISIARAILAEPKILILDEATSSVDTKTEKQIQDAMAHLMKDRTSLIIAHRLSTIQDADVIVVLDGGRIAESGSHDELIAARGRYYELYMTQFAGGTI